MSKMKILSLFVAALLCLGAAGCGTRRDIPAGELDASSLPLTLESDIDTEQPAQQPADEAPSMPEEMKSDVSSQPARLSEPARKEENEAQKPEISPTDSSSIASAASSSSPDTPALTPVMAPAVFCPPDHPSVYEHTEYTLEDFWAWLNSEEALTEENGAYQETVNFYRSCKSFPLASMDTKDLPARWYKLYSNGGLGVLFSWPDGTYNGPADIYICPFADKEVPMAKNGAVSYFKAKGNTVASGPVAVKKKLTEYSTENVDMTADWWNMKLPTQLASRSVSVEGQAVEAVLDVRPFVVDSAYTISCVRFLHWFQDGFQVRCGFRCVGPDKVNDIDEEMLSKLTFTDVSLTQSIK